MDDCYDICLGMCNFNSVEIKGVLVMVNWWFSEDVVVKYVVVKCEFDSEVNIDFDSMLVKVVDVGGIYIDNQVSNELQFNYDVGGCVCGVVGLYQFSGEVGGQICNNFFNLQFVDIWGKVIMDSIVFYVDWIFDLISMFKFDFGVCYIDEDKCVIVLNCFYVDVMFIWFVVVVVDFDKIISFRNVLFKVLLDYQIILDIMVYGLVICGFKLGGYNICVNVVVVFCFVELFDDEIVDSFEVGSKMVFFDQCLFFNLLVFYNKYKDIQLLVFMGIDINGDGVDDVFFGDFINVGVGIINGLEVEYQYLLIWYWFVIGNLVWLYICYDEYMDCGFNVVDQMKFINVLKVFGVLNVEYCIDLVRGGNLFVWVGYSYQSEVWLIMDLSLVICQQGCGLVNVGVIWWFDDVWIFLLQGDNLVDKVYCIIGYNILVVGMLIGFYGLLCQYSFSVCYDFQKVFV